MINVKSNSIDYNVMLLYLIVGAGVMGTAMLTAFLMLMPYSNQDYALDVDAFKDKIDVMDIYRVIITNTGRNDVTNVVVDYGTYKDFIPRIKPGEKISLSPRDDANKEYVVITAEPSIHIMKEYRSMPKAPGMIGGMR
ncbi:hypothetical protein HRbin05_00576 [archaeon HR05]|jgi:hypothetical protein|uniref:Uncharacterized protein n=2 Tax=Candidatus Nitrosocaldaceae TaxID=1968910 RepID=A0A2K5AQ02_9ARCH|nr:hypothetical protein HRbin05_00576 [archaeon HR05]SPC33687.1 conserved protein of unknown function [Candidatus Nitrosocaldus cavascurensis]